MHVTVLKIFILLFLVISFFLSYFPSTFRKSVIISHLSMLIATVLLLFHFAFALLGNIQNKHVLSYLLSFLTFSILMYDLFYLSIRDKKYYLKLTSFLTLVIFVFSFVPSYFASYFELSFNKSFTIYLYALSFAAAYAAYILAAFIAYFSLVSKSPLRKLAFEKTSFTLIRLGFFLQSASLLFILINNVLYESYIFNFNEKGRIFLTIYLLYVFLLIIRNASFHIKLKKTFLNIDSGILLSLILLFFSTAGVILMLR